MIIFPMIINENFEDEEKFFFGKIKLFFWNSIKFFLDTLLDMWLKKVESINNQNIVSNISNIIPNYNSQNINNQKINPNDKI